ncbi:MAG: 3-dehydroquinate synthase, partial [Deltaproteobacteria bacterium]|nr:3-dehydroquinate synthase [Deltaproteobacteria bacterium]
MERQVLIQTSLGNYPVLIGAGAAGRLGKLGDFAQGAERIVVLCDRKVAELHRDKLQRDLPAAARMISIDSGEASKSWKVAGGLLDQLAAVRIQRNDLLITVGGGVVGDLGG